MKQVHDDLLERVRDFYARHRGLDDPAASVRLSEDKWSLKEIIGHLVDSASNNHQRFTRLQLARICDFPSYECESWRGVERFNELPWSALLDLWLAYNRFVAHLMLTADPASLQNVWDADGKQRTLEFIMKDYLRHLNDHVAHFEQRLEELREANRG